MGAKMKTASVVVVMRRQPKTSRERPGQRSHGMETLETQRTCPAVRSYKL